MDRSPPGSCPWDHPRQDYLSGFSGDASSKEPTYQGKTLRDKGQSLGREDPLMEGMATHSSSLDFILDLSHLFFFFLILFSPER